MRAFTAMAWLLVALRGSKREKTEVRDEITGYTGGSAVFFMMVL